MPNPNAVHNFLTVCSLNYLHYATTLYSSLNRCMADFQLYIILSDVHYCDTNEIEKLIGSNMTVVTMGQMGAIYDYSDMLKFYNILEFNSLLKVHAIRYAFCVLNLKSCVFLDPDTYLFAKMDYLEFENHNESFLFSPHVNEYASFKTDNDCSLELIYSGLVNGGFIFCKNNERSIDILNWLINKTEHSWFVAPALGMYADQNWFTVIALLSDDVALIREQSINVAYWNLQERLLMLKNGAVAMQKSGQALTMFHFSGFPEPYNGNITKHAEINVDRETLVALKFLCELYSSELKKSRELLVNLDIKKTVSFSKESLFKRISLVESAYGFKYDIPDTPKGFFESAGNLADRIIKRILRW